MAWEKLGTNTITVTTSPISISDFTAKFFNIVLSHDLPTTTRLLPALQFNDDATNIYAQRYNVNGGTDVLAANQNHIRWGNGTTVDWEFMIGYVFGLSTSEKLEVGFAIFGDDGANNAPQRQHAGNKWTNTSSGIIAMRDDNQDSGDFGGYAADSNLTALGTD